MDSYGSKGQYIGFIEGPYFISGWFGDGISWTSHKHSAARLSENEIQECQNYLDNWYDEDSPFIVKERVA